MATSNALQIARYFEKVLGLSKVGSGFFIQEHPPLSQAAVILPVKCWLVDFHQSDLPSVQPTILEMALKLKAAIEAEWVKHGLSGQVRVEWLTSDQYQRAGNVGHEMGLVIFFGELRESRRFHSASSVEVLVPRLDEMNMNPSLKRDAWRKIQYEIAQFSAGLGAS
ncbi:MAG: hypothetical protein J0L82_16925 [Deltaproteobacteria bacterium]|jgi:hypothetical protein|nr:hypothetical protein [Deltaproteobacteria bacterium]